MCPYQCDRCGKQQRTYRRYQAHMRAPCSEDNVIVRRAKALERKTDGVPRRPVLRGRKNMMRA